MRYVFHCIALAAALAFVDSSRAQEPRPQIRDGWWLSVGTGVANLGYGCQGCDTLEAQPKGIAPTLRVKIGGTFTSQLLLGLQVDMWVKNTTDLAWILGTVFYYYPREEGGFFFGGGFGHMGYTSNYGPQELQLLSNGFGLIVGVGRDVRIGPKVSLTPVLNVAAGGFGAMRIDKLLAGRNFNQLMIELGVGITLH